MQRTIATGIDVGTHHVKVVIAERSGNPKIPPRILGTGYAESRGMRHGYIISGADITKSVEAAVAQAQSAAKVRVKRAFLGIGGVSLDELFSRGEAVVTRGDSEVTDRDLEQALSASQAALSPSQTLNKKIIHSIPLRYTVDGTKVLGGNPVGMKGMKLSVETLFITTIGKHMRDLIDAVEEAGVEVEDVVASPLAASFVTLSKPQKMAGCVLANIGAETLSIIVFEDGLPLSVKAFPMGSSDITNDIALGLRVPLEEAEQIKLGAITGTTYPRKKLDDIISRRLADMFKLVEAHLKKLGKDGLLPAGIIITGGGSGVATVVDLAKAVLRLPSRVGTLMTGDAGKMQLRDGSWAVAYGLTIWGFTAGGEYEKNEAGHTPSFLREIGRFFKKFLP